MTDVASVVDIRLALPGLNYVRIRGLCLYGASCWDLVHVVQHSRAYSAFWAAVVAGMAPAAIYAEQLGLANSDGSYDDGGLHL